MSAETKADETVILSTRKDQHLDIVAKKDVAFGGLALGLGRFTLEYDALPEIDLDEVDLSTTLFGKKLASPIVIGAMTGGSPRAGRVNERLARVAARCGIGIALGSQRAMIVDKSLTSTYAVRAAAPDVPLVIGNVGAVQLNYGVTAEMIEEALQSAHCDALNFHLNPLQEACQPEGDTRFAGLGAKIADATKKISMPVLVKEVGAGLSRRALAKLAALPIAGVEVAGVGGTSWAKVESHRAPEGSSLREIGMRLGGMGVPVPESIAMAREAFASRVVVGSGGIRTGMDCAVALALGADVVSFAAPLLLAVEESEAQAEHVLRTILHELRVIAFCCGAKNLAELKQVRVIATSGASMRGVADTF